jgi:hypothetical protein
MAGTESKNTALFGAFVITRRTQGYLTWTYGTDVPMLVKLSTNKEDALSAAKKEAETIVKHVKVLEKDKPCRTAYGVREIQIGQEIKQLDWNDCVGYFEHYVSPNR